MNLTKSRILFGGQACECSIRQDYVINALAISNLLERREASYRCLQMKNISTEKRKICVVTGTRAEYGLLKGLLSGIEQSRDFSLQLLVTGMHLSPEFGFTKHQIVADGFKIAREVEALLSGDSGSAIAKSMGVGVIGIADALKDLEPDLVVVLGDRYEILAVAQTCLVMSIPLAHIAGGDVTEGAFDDSIRHAITKMAHIHFPTTDFAKTVLMQLGENEKDIHVVGSPGIDQIRHIKYLDKTEIEEKLKFTFRDKNMLITFHPVTIGSESSVKELRELFAALESFPEYGLIFTAPNADPQGRILASLTEKFVECRDNAVMEASLGTQLYLSVMKIADVVVGNSSSGLYEAPSFNVPTINIGNRQDGRLRADSVIDCAPTRRDIVNALRLAVGREYDNVKNPYGDGGSSSKILGHLREYICYRDLVKKQFFLMRD